MPIKTADLIDAHSDHLTFCNLPFRLFGRVRSFSGVIATIRCFEDNVLISQTLDQPGKGRVLVVDAGGSTRCAVVGDLMAEKAMKSGWAGLIIHGAIRDSVEISDMDFSVMALATSPVKSGKTGAGILDAPIAFGNAKFIPGQHVHADDDGILVSERALAQPRKAGLA